MEYLQDAIEVNKEALKKTFKQLKFVPILSIILIVMNLAQNFTLGLLMTNLSGVNFLLGFVRYFIRVLFMSAIIAILSDIVLYNRFSLNRVFEGYVEFFNQVSATLFVFVILDYISYFVITSTQIALLITVYNIAIFIMMSVVYEQIYIAGRSGVDVFYKTFEFLKENILQWILVLVLFVYLQTAVNTNLVISSIDIKRLISTLIYSILLAFVFIYKGHLFNILYASSVRKRKFMRKF